MASKHWISSSLSALSGLAAFVGLLVDFQGVASVIGKLFEVAKAFIPLIAIFGTTYCSLWFLVIITQLIKKRLPSSKFKMLSDEIDFCKQLIIDENNFFNFKLDSKQEISIAIYALSLKLYKFSIPHPDTNTDNEAIMQSWLNYLVVLSECARSGELRKARGIKKVE